MNVFEYIVNELAADDIDFTVKTYAAVMEAARKVNNEIWPQARADFERELEEWRAQRLADGMKEIGQTAQNLSEIEKRERELAAAVDAETEERRRMFCLDFMKKRLMSDPDDDVRRTATALATPRETLSKIHTKYGAIQTEEDRLGELVPKAVCNLKAKLIEEEIKEVTRRIAAHQQAGDHDSAMAEMRRLIELNDMKKTLAKYLGERILVPVVKR